MTAQWHKIYSLYRLSANLLALIGVLLIATIPTAQAANTRRVALVIGNGMYKSAPVLENPSVDAHAVAAALKRIGFEVIEGYDLPSIGMREKLGEFSTAVRESKVALVYYAGHGVSVDEENYLLPIDLVLRSAADLEIHGISVSSILRQMKREERANVLILDACRNNPFAEQMAADNKQRAMESERGLSRIEGGLAKGALIAFATDPKQAALDGPKGENSPFTRALLKNIETPGMTIDAVMSRVREEVWTVTAHKQMPWVNTSLVGGDLFLNPVAAAAVEMPALSAPAAQQPLAGPMPDRLTMENKLWDSAEKANAAEDYQVYLDAYPTGIYAQMAKNRIGRLKAPALVAATVLPLVGAAVAARQPEAIVANAAPVANGVPAAELVVAKPAISASELKIDVATPASEKLLNLTDMLRREIKLRLKVIGFETGSQNGRFDDKTRAAIGEWQKSREIHPTAALSRVQLAALNEQSEAQYQRFLTAQPMVPQTRSVISPPRRVAPAIRHAQRQRARSGGGGGGGSSNGVMGNVGEFFGGVARGVLRLR